MNAEEIRMMKAEMRKKAISEMLLPLVVAKVAGGGRSNVYDNEGMQACIDYALRMAIRIQNAKEKL
jgi:hypothetical protein